VTDELDRAVQAMVAHLHQVVDEPISRVVTELLDPERGDRFPGDPKLHPPAVALHAYTPCDCGCPDRERRVEVRYIEARGDGQ
jgi:hypothetical protein